MSNNILLSSGTASDPLRRHVQLEPGRSGGAASRVVPGGECDPLRVVLPNPWTASLVVTRTWSHVAPQAREWQLYDPGEPAGQFGAPTAISAPSGGVVANTDIAMSQSLPPIEWNMGDPVASKVPQKLHSRMAGAIVDLDDERFSEAHGREGFWEGLSFYKKYGGNVYFLEAYDPKKIPILF